MDKQKVVKHLEYMFKKFKRSGYYNLMKMIEEEKFNEQTYTMIWLLNTFFRDKSIGKEREGIVPVLEYLEPILFCSMLDREVQGVDAINTLFNKYREKRDEYVQHTRVK